MIYYVKEIFYNDRFYNVILQQQNGSCPLICICNIFILRGILTLSSRTTVTSEQLLTALHSIILDILDHKKEKKLQYEEKYSNVIDVINSLEYGVNIDVQFDHAKSFESSATTDLFLLCGIQLIHGWLPDPKSDFAQVKRLSYNSIEEHLAISNEKKSKPEISILPTNPEHELKESLIDEKQLSNEELLNLGSSFMKTYPSQLTEYGIQILQSSLKQDTFFSFFRNNHFSILINHKNQLYTLITDIGYANRSACVWERIDSIQSTTLCKPDFITPYHDIPISSSVPEETIQDIREIPQEVIGINKSIEEIHKEQLDIEHIIINNNNNNDSSNSLDNKGDLLSEKVQENDDETIAELLQAEEYEAAAYSKKCSIM